MRLARACIALACVALGPTHAAGFDIASLFDSIAREPPGRATFRETKFLALLDRPLETSGELVFTPPDRLEKRTLKPRPESVTVDRERVVLERSGKRRSLALREQPQVAVLVGAFAPRSPATSPRSRVPIPRRSKARPRAGASCFARSIPRWARWSSASRSAAPTRRCAASRSSRRTATGR